MSDDDDHKVKIALLAQSVASVEAKVLQSFASLERKIDKLERDFDKRSEKTESVMKWGALLVVSAVLSQVFKLVGFS